MDRAWAAPLVLRAAADPVTKAIKRSILSLILFGIAFGYLEASVVVYLRALSGPMRVSAGLSSDDLFPLLNFRQVAPNLYLIKIEVLREAATLVMLATVAAAMAKNLRTWLAAFALAFGVWDLSFYGFLKVLIGWPESLLTWDLLFLLPVPWTGPVLSPVIVATSLVIGGILAMVREPPRGKWFSWSALLLGGAIILSAFTWDWRYILYGGIPRHFPWLLFATGEFLGVCGLSFGLMSFSFPISAQDEWGGSPDPRRAPSPGLSTLQPDPNGRPGGPGTGKRPRTRAAANAGVRPTKTK